MRCSAKCGDCRPDWLAGCRLRACWFEPTFHKHAGKLCAGLQTHVEDASYDHTAFRPWRLQALAFKALRNLRPDYELWRDFPYEYEHERLAIDLINGSELLRQWVDDRSATAGRPRGAGARRRDGVGRAAPRPAAVPMSAPPTPATSSWSGAASTAPASRVTRPAAACAPCCASSTTSRRTRRRPAPSSSTAACATSSSTISGWCASRCRNARWCSPRPRTWRGRCASCCRTTRTCARRG